APTAARFRAGRASNHAADIVGVNGNCVLGAELAGREGQEARNACQRHAEQQCLFGPHLCRLLSVRFNVVFNCRRPTLKADLARQPVMFTNAVLKSSTTWCRSL